MEVSTDVVNLFEPFASDKNKELSPTVVDIETGYYIGHFIST
jgi:hypothetical protein